MSNKPTALGMHIYAGGFSQGLKDHFDIWGHYETSDFGVKTMQENLGITGIIRRPGDSAAFAGRPNLVFGNPPCVAFSRLGHREYLQHPSIQDVRSLLALGTSLKPDVWVWECVPQAFSMGQELVEEVHAAWERLGYHCTMFFTDANLHGAAQRRQRFHFIAHRVKLHFYDPTEQPGFRALACGEVLSSMQPEVDVKHLKVRRYLQWMEPYALPGYPLRKIWFWLHGLNPNKPKPEELRLCPPFCLQRLHQAYPSCTLTGGPDFVHPTAWRVLSPGEMAVLSGYPSTWKWVGNLVDQYKQVAKGVTPAIARYLGDVFARGIRQGEGVSQPGFEIVDFRPLANKLWDKRLEPFPEAWKGIAQNNEVKAC